MNNMTFRRLASLTIGGALLMLALQGCNRAPAQAKATQAPVAAPVDTVTARTGPVSAWIPVTGSLESLQDVSLSSRIPGRLAAVLVREGDSVSAGQAVAQLDSADQLSAVRSAEATVNAAQARLAQARSAYTQVQVSARAGVQSAEAVFTQQQVTTRTGIESAQAGLEAARAQLTQVKDGARSQEVRRSETQVAIARAALAKADSDVKRFAALAREGAVSDSMLETYQTAQSTASENLRAAQETLSLMKEGARTTEVTQAEQGVRLAEEKLRQARAAAAMDDVRKADVETARAGLAQVEVRRADVQAAQAAVRQATGSLDIARKALADTVITSPVAGRIASRTSEPGQVVGAGTPILRVVALDAVYFEPTVSEREIGRIDVGRTVDVTVAAYPGATFRGEVTRIYPAASEKSRSFPVRIALANPGGKLRPQMYAQGRILAESHADAVQVPVGALVRDEAAAQGTAVLYLADGGKAREVKVTTGLQSADGQWIEVHGVQPGAQVVVGGQSALSNGDAVAAKPAAGGK